MVKNGKVRVGRWGDLRMVCFFSGKSENRIVFHGGNAIVRAILSEEIVKKRGFLRLPSLKGERESSANSTFSKQIGKERKKGVILTS